VAKKTRKQLLKEQDAFLQAASSSAEWFQENRGKVIALSVAGFCLIAAVWGGAEYIRHRDGRASELLQNALKYWDAEVVAEGADIQAEPEGDPPTFATADAKHQTIIQELAAVSGYAAGTGVDQLAQFYMAEEHYRSGDKQSALKAFKGLLLSLGEDDNLTFLAVERTAYLQEELGQVDEAIATLKRVANRQGRFYADYTAYHQARLYQTKGDSDRAQNILEKIEKDYPESPAREQVKSRLVALSQNNATPKDADAGSKGEDKP